MNKLKIPDKLELLICILIVFFIPILKTPVRYLMIFWVIMVIINTIRTRKFYKNQIIKFYPLLLLPIFYLLHVLGLIHTSNISEGLFNLEIKLSLIIVPIGLYLRREIYTNTKLIFIRTFILACFISVLINVIHSYILFLTVKEFNVFYYNNLSWNLHPTYSSIYIITALIFLLEFKAKQIFFSIKYAKPVKLLLIIIFLVYFIMLSSKAAILSFLIVSVFYCYRYFMPVIKNKFAVISIAVILSSILFYAIISIPGLHYRFSEMFSSSRQHIKSISENKKQDLINENDVFEVDITDFYQVTNIQGGTSVRILLWKSSIRILKTNYIFGTGTGDFIDELNIEYEKLNPDKKTTIKYNAHNQYLQSLVSLGFLGLLSLLLIIITGFKYSVKYKNYLFLYFIMIFTINMMFESLLEQQLGVIYFAFFYSLFYIWE